jgi:tetratricopeptide (TPR) repeat protein
VTPNLDVSYACSAVRAYREDLERIGERPFLRTLSADARWLEDALWLERQAFLGGRPPAMPKEHVMTAVRSRFRTKRIRAAILEGAADLEPGVAEVLQRAEEMEVSGGLTLASSLISAARAIWIDRAPRGATLALVHMGRIARTLGHHGAASTLYANAERDARKLGFDTAQSRALLGKGVIHHESGRLEEASRHYRAAARIARHAPPVRAMAWLGLSSIAHRKGDVAASVGLGLRALLDAPENAERRAEVLVNIAYAALAAGQPVVAQDSARWVLRHRVHERSRCLAIAAAALAAARLGRNDVVRHYVALARRESSTVSLPYPEALMWAFVARAERTAGLHTESRGAASRAKALAARHGFSGIEAEADRLLVAATVGPTVSRRVIARLELAIGAL